MTAQAKGKTRQNTKKTPKLSGDEVSDWLIENPEFFTTREELLSKLTLSHHLPGTSSLIEKQVMVLRKHNKTLEKKLFELIDIARDNEKLSLQMHHMGMVLITADNLDDTIASARNELDTVFNPEIVSLKVFTRSTADKAAYYVNPREVSQLFAHSFRTRSCLCGNLNKEQKTFLFDQADSTIKSAVFIPLYEHHPLGYVALGSTNPKQFTQSLGTHFLDNLGEMISCAIHKAQSQS